MDQISVSELAWASDNFEINHVFKENPGFFKQNVLFLKTSSIFVTNLTNCLVVDEDWLISSYRFLDAYTLHKNKICTIFTTPSVKKALSDSVKITVCEQF